MPDPNEEHDMGGQKLSMAEMPTPDMIIPGMLTGARMAQLKAARGASDGAKVRLLAASVRSLARAR